MQSVHVSRRDPDAKSELRRARRRGSPLPARKSADCLADESPQLCRGYVTAFSVGQHKPQAPYRDLLLCPRRDPTAHAPTVAILRPDRARRRRLENALHLRESRHQGMPAIYALYRDIRAFSRNTHYIASARIQPSRPPEHALYRTLHGRRHRRILPCVRCLSKTASPETVDGASTPAPPSPPAPFWRAVPRNRRRRILPCVRCCRRRILQSSIARMLPTPQQTRSYVSPE